MTWSILNAGEARAKVLGWEYNWHVQGAARRLVWLDGTETKGCGVIDEARGETRRGTAGIQVAHKSA